MCITIIKHGKKTYIKLSERAILLAIKNVDLIKIEVKCRFYLIPVRALRFSLLTKFVEMPSFPNVTLRSTLFRYSCSYL